MTPDRKLEWDWFPGRVPENVTLDETAYLETTYSFELFRSREANAVRIGRGSSIYLGVMFDLGPAARVRVGDFTLMNGSRVICDAAIEIGDYCLISWNTVLMDTYRVPAEPALRRPFLERFADTRIAHGDLEPGRDALSRIQADRQVGPTKFMERATQRTPRGIQADVPARPIHIGNNVWIGFDSCVLPGSNIGDGAIVGARSVVVEDVPPYTVVAGNPARVIRQLEPGESPGAANSTLQLA
jgi:acetyltransferase-like isoleucine patch superfamily enzyme